MFREVRNTYTLENSIVDRPVPNIQICSRIIHSHFISLIYSTSSVDDTYYSNYSDTYMYIL